MVDLREKFGGICWVGMLGEKIGVGVCVEIYVKFFLFGNRIVCVSIEL